MGHPVGRLRSLGASHEWAVLPLGRSPGRLRVILSHLQRTDWRFPEGAHSSNPARGYFPGPRMA